MVSGSGSGVMEFRVWGHGIQGLGSWSLGSGVMEFGTFDILVPSIEPERRKGSMTRALGLKCGRCRV